MPNSILVVLATGQVQFAGIFLSLYRGERVISFAVGLQSLQAWVRKNIFRKMFVSNQDRVVYLFLNYWLQHISHISGEYSSKPLKHSIVKRIFT